MNRRRIGPRTCVIIGPRLKKFSDLHGQKKRSAEFAQVCPPVRDGRLAPSSPSPHTPKNPNADGTPRYQGTTDISDDFDAV
jgi:hypothetical protein